MKTEFVWNIKSDGMSLKDKLEAFVHSWTDGEISKELLAEILLAVIETIEKNNSGISDNPQA